MKHWLWLGLFVCRVSISDGEVPYFKLARITDPFGNEDAVELKCFQKLAAGLPEACYLSRSQEGKVVAGGTVPFAEAKALVKPLLVSCSPSTERFLTWEVSLGDKSTNCSASQADLGKGLRGALSSVLRNVLSLESKLYTRLRSVP